MRRCLPIADADERVDSTGRRVNDDAVYAVYVVYCVFGLAAIGVFRLCRPAVAAMLVFLGGWVLLPVANYPPGSASGAFPYWIIGTALPSDILLDKAWVAPLGVLLGAAFFDRRTLLAWRPGTVDLCIAAWCLWPLCQSFFVDRPQPSGWIASGYLTGCWGLTWFIGRVYFSSAAGRLDLLRGLALSALALLPFSIVEGVFGVSVYGLVYGPHPFRFDGSERYLGFRPVGFFEHGNQFGLWLCLGALCAAWLAWTAPEGRPRRWLRAGAGLVVAMALAAQSVGAIGLLWIGASMLAITTWLRPRWLIAIALAAFIGGAAVYVSGAVPVLKIGKETAIGREVVEALKWAGRGSLGWRIVQDQKLLHDATAHPVVGSGRWDWWRAKGTRPWDLAMLLLGQYGGVGVLLCLGSLTWPAVRAAWAAPRASGWQAEGRDLLLATVVLLTLVDALMNSFIFFPAVVVAGGLAASARQRVVGEITRIPNRGTAGSKAR